MGVVEVRKALQGLVNLGLRNETLDTFNDKLQALDLLLRENNIPETGPEYEILDREAIIAQTIFHEPVLEKEDFHRVQHYAGRRFKQTTIVNHEYHTVTISNTYSPPQRGIETKIEVIWNFNIDGRVQWVDTRTHNEKPKRIITIYPEKPLETDWRSNKGEYSDFPAQISFINRTIREKTERKKCSLLLYYGHQIVFDILSNPGNYDSVPGEEPISNILQNKGALYLLKNAAELFPRLVMSGEKSFTLLYEKRKK